MTVRREVKANSHPSFNFADLFPTLSKWPEHCAHPKRGAAEVSRPLYAFPLDLPNSATLSLGTPPPHPMGVVWGDPGTLLPICSASAQGSGGTGSPGASPVRRAALQAHHGRRHPKRGKIFQFKLSGTELGIIPRSQDDEPCSAHRFSQPHIENKVYLVACFLW